jgi:hypothetical protein
MKRILKAGLLLILCAGVQGQTPNQAIDAAVDPQEMTKVATKKNKKKIKYTCQQKCFSHCKFKNQAVDDCQIANATSVSFSVICSCRALKKGEVLPAFFQNTRIIKTSASGN